MNILNKIKSFFGGDPEPAEPVVGKELGGKEAAVKVVAPEPLDPEEVVAVPQPPVGSKADDEPVLPERKEPEQPATPKKIKKKKKKAIATISPISLDICVENLDEAGQVMAVQGSGEQQYLVDLATLSCTCMDFVKSRSKFAHNDIRRLCKHQAGLIAASGQEVEAEEILRAMLKGLGGKSFQRYTTAVEVILNEEIEGPDSFYLFSEEGRDWIDVLLLTDGSLQKYGFNLKKKQWASQRNPFPKASRGKYSRAMQIALQDELPSS